MHRKRWLFPAVFLLLALLVYSYAWKADTPDATSWGSFTDQPVITSDGLYRAEHKAVKEDGMATTMIRVDIYLHHNNKPVATFYPARASDFWGVCWQEDTYSLWIQSGDTGIFCYEKTDDGWQVNENAIRPDTIVSKWDK